MGKEEKEELLSPGIASRGELEEYEQQKIELAVLWILGRKFRKEDLLTPACNSKTCKTGALISQMDLLASLASYFRVPIPAGEAADSQPFWLKLTGKSKDGRTTFTEEGYNDPAILHNGRKYIPALGKKQISCTTWKRISGRRSILLKRNRQD